MTSRQNLLTAMELKAQCPSMPGRFGPTYAEQIKAVEKWMPPLMRNFYERQQWRKDPHVIFSLYCSCKEYERELQQPSEQKDLNS